MGKPIRELFYGLIPDSELNSDIIIEDIVLNSKHAKTGDLFVVLPGQRTHGIHFVQDAINRGAVAILSSVHIDMPRVEVPVLRVDNPRICLAHIASRLYDVPAHDLHVTGITGTNGKTTVVYLLRHILSNAGTDPAYWSTPWTNSGVKQFRPAMTTPDPPELHRFFAQAKSVKKEHVVMEVSSHAIALNRIGTVNFDCAIVTNITPDHLDFHGTFQTYVATKRRLVEMLSPGAACILNLDDPNVRSFADATKGTVVTYGFHPDADVRAINPRYSNDGIFFQLVLSSGLIPLDEEPPLSHSVHVPLQGPHNIQNVLGAIAAAIWHGVSLPTIVSSLKTFAAPVRRLETQKIGPYTIINDVAMNLGSYEAVLSTLSSVQHENLVIVNAIRGNRGVEVNRDIATMLARWEGHLHFAPLIISVSRSHVKQLAVDYNVRPEELDAFVSECTCTGLPFELFEELDNALSHAIERLGNQGTLVLLGTFGMDFANDIVAELLKTRMEV